MLIEKFEDMQAWQKARAFTVSLYKELRDCHDYGFKDQAQRASVSIMNNVAEGFERRSRKELKQFLTISKGSAGEVRSMLHLAKDLGYIKGASYNIFVADVSEVSKMLGGFIGKI